MMVCDEDVVNWFQGLKGHQRIPLMRQLVHMCHPLELRFIASCVEDACRTDCLAMRTAELNANTQSVLKSLSSPLDVEARSKIIIYLCLLNSTNKLCSRILNQKICDHESVSQFCDDVHRQLMDGELPSSEEQRTLEELRLLYMLAFLHPTFDFIERQHYRDMCSRMNELENELKKLERKEEQKLVESVVPKPCCDGGSHRDNPSKTCSLCFSTSSSEHICKLRLLRRSSRPHGGDFENQVNVQWSTGKYSNLAIRDKQLRQLHAKLEGIISQPRLPPFPREPGENGQMNGYLQHLQGLSAVTWPRSEPVYQFFRQLADEQEQRSRAVGVARPHSVYTPRQPTANGLPPGPETHKLTMPIQNGTTEGDDSETSPVVLDDDTEVKSYTIYNSNITNGRAGSHSPLSVSLLPLARPAVSRSCSPEPQVAWSPRPAHTPGLANGVVRARSADAERLQHLLAGDKTLRKHADRLLPLPLAQLRALSDEQFQELGVRDGELRRLRALLEEAAGGGRSGGSVHRRRAHRVTSRSGSRDKDEPPRPAATAAAAAAAAATAARDRPANKTVAAAVSPRAAGSAAPAGGGAPLKPPVIPSQTSVVVPAPAVLMPGVGGQTHTMPTYSAVTAQNVTSVAGALVDGGRSAVSDGQLAFTAQSTSSPPPTVLSAGYRAAPRSVGDRLSAASSPSPPAPAASPAASHAPQGQQQPPPQTLGSFMPPFPTRPPPPLPQLGFMYTATGGFLPTGFSPAPDMPGFYAYAPHPVQYAASVARPPRAASAAPPPPPRPQSCYNCGQGHLGRHCPLENAMNDASLQNQFKMAFVSSISEN